MANWKNALVLCTKALKGSSMTWWGRRRWAIEGFFKIALHRFGLHSFGQQTLHRSLQMVSPILNRLSASSRSLISIQEGELYRIGVKLLS